MKIISVKKRNPLACFFTIKHYQVVLEDDSQFQVKRNMWAGIEGQSGPEADKLLYSIDAEFGTDLQRKFLRGQPIEGLEIAEEVIEGKVRNTQLREISILVNQKKAIKKVQSTIWYGK